MAMPMEHPAAVVEIIPAAQWVVAQNNFLPLASAIDLDLMVRNYFDPTSVLQNLLSIMVADNQKLVAVQRTKQMLD